MLFKKSKPKKLYKYLSHDGAKALFSADKFAVWFRLANKLNDLYDLNPAGQDLHHNTGGIGVCCLSETFDSSPMWAHYADGGNGVVIEFDTDHDFFKQFTLAKVKYSKRRPVIGKDKNTIAVKGLDWSYEKEWRYLTTLWRGGNFLHQQQAISYEIPLDAITSVIFRFDYSCSCDSCCFTFIMNFLKKEDAKHIAPYVLRLDKLKFNFKKYHPFDLSYIVENKSSTRNIITNIYG